MFYDIQFALYPPNRIKAMECIDHLEKQDNTVVPFPIDIFPANSFTLVVQDVEFIELKSRPPSERLYGNYKILAKLRFELTDFLGNAHLEKFVIDPASSNRPELHKLKEFTDFGIHTQTIKEMLEKSIKNR